jgi:hypothetical protein
VKLQNVDIIPKSHYNLISITKLMEEGHKVTGNKEDGITVKKSRQVIKFDIRAKIPKGVLGEHTSSKLSLTEKSLQE